MANGPKKNVVVDSAGFSKTIRKIKPSEWKCPKKNCPGHDRDPRGHYVFQNKDQCNLCGTSKPPKPWLFKDSPAGRDQAAKGGGAAGGGGRAESAIAKDIRETKERIAKKEQQAELDKLKAAERRLDGGGGKRSDEPGQGTDKMETDAAGDGGGISMEKLEQAMHRREDDLKYWQGKLRELKKEEEADAATQEGHDRAKDLFEKARQAVWDGKDPHEQMSKKSTKSERLARKVISLEQELKGHMEDKLAAEQKAEECQSKIDTAIDEIEANKAEIQKLLEESHTIREKMVGSNPEGISELVDKQCASTLGMFDDPLIAELEDVRAKRPDVVALTNTIAEALRALALVTAQVKGGLDEAKEKAAVEAKQLAVRVFLLFVCCYL